MNLFQELKSLGVNTDEGLKRMGGNSSLYERMLIKLKDLIKDYHIGTDFDCNDYADIIELAHTIKGASGNLEVMPIYEIYTEFVDLLRKKQPEQAKEYLEKSLPIQKAIIDCIDKYS